MSNLIVSPELKERNPLITDAGLKMLKRLSEHEHAPIWNHTAGDRIDAADLDAVNEFRRSLNQKSVHADSKPSESILQWVERRRASVPLFRKHLSNIFGLERSWNDIPTMSREDIATSPELVVPDDADLDKMIVYRTAGTTGHALLVPHAARAAAMYHPLQERALGRYGIEPKFDAETVGCFLVCAQARTVTYPTVLSVWNQTGFAKINISPRDWPSPTSASHYLSDMNPHLLTGDPISFAEMMRQELPASPVALISTAVAMSSTLKTKLQNYYKCPVIDWYSLTETGPIAYFCRDGFGYHLLSQDVYVEAIDADGNPVPKGTAGEITVTGGRNPFLPLLRYRTGDWGKLSYEKCSCGDPAPRLLDLEGRQPVLFRNSSGDVVNAVDLSNILRDFPLIQHEFIQRKDGTCLVTIRPIAGSSIAEDELKAAIHVLFGQSTRLEIAIDPELGDRKPSGKVVPYQSELSLED